MPKRAHRRNSRLSRMLREFWKLIYPRRKEVILAAVSVLFLLSGTTTLWAASLKIPDVESLSNRKITQSTKIYDRTGEVLLDDLGENIVRTVVSLDEISPWARMAAIAIEDSEFYRHRGIRLTSMARAVMANARKAIGLSNGYTQGGSTITQQVVKNTMLTNDRTITRKVKEIILSLKLDAALPKDTILELYLNGNPYGGTIYGIEEASQQYFGIKAKDLGLAQATYLAALPQAPTYYSPYGNHRDALEARKNLVLSRMKELGYITEEEYEKAKAEEITFKPQVTSGARAHHFLFFVREQLEQEFGEAALEESGWRVITTLDADLEAKAEEVVQTFGEENEKNFNASNASIVAVEPRTGDILAMAGSRDYFNETIEGAYNIALAKRQPGSAFKPFVYAQAFLEGYTPDTVLFDTPTQFSTECAPNNLSSEPPCYAPIDYDGAYRGPMTIRNALAQSINIPAVKALYLVGIRDALSLARSMGITTLNDPDRYGLTLVLGGGEVTLLDMASAYGVFANGGVRNSYRAVIRIEDKSGNIVKQYPLSPARVLDQNVALTITDILSDNAARAPELGAFSPLYFPGIEVASKTGTTNDYRDAWVLGYTPNIAVGAWAGNNDNSPMVKKIAGFIVAPLWHAFTEYALTKYPNDPFPEAQSLTLDTDKPILRGIWQGGDVVKVDATTLAPVPPAYTGATKNKITASVHDTLYWLDKNNPRGPAPADPSADPQFPRWELSARNWAAEHGYVDGVVFYQ